MVGFFFQVPVTAASTTAAWEAAVCPNRRQGGTGDITHGPASIMLWRYQRPLKSAEVIAGAIDDDISRWLGWPRAVLCPRWAGKSGWSLKTTSSMADSRTCCWPGRVFTVPPPSSRSACPAFCQLLRHLVNIHRRVAATTLGAAERALAPTSHHRHAGTRCRPGGGA